MERSEVDVKTLLGVYEAVTNKMGIRIKEKGQGAFSGPHEIYGVLAEEVNELLDAIHENDKEQVVNELYDVAVTALFGIASIYEVENRVKELREKLEAEVATV